MRLYKITAADTPNYITYFGEAIDTAIIDRSYVTRIAQTPNCDSFLFLCEDEQDANLVELQSSVPSGFDFTYCQDWGLEVTQDKIDRVIADLSQ